MPQGKNGGKRPGSFSSKSHALRLGAKPKNKTSKHRPEFDFSDQPKHHGPRTQEAAQVWLHQRLCEFVIDRISHDGRSITQCQCTTFFVDGAFTGGEMTSRFISERRHLC